MDRTRLTFRYYQTLCDLQAVAVRLHEKLDSQSDLAQAIDPAVFVVNSSSRILNWRLDLDDRAYALIEPSRAENGDAFLFATCMRLLDRFENPERGSDFKQEWLEFAPIYRAAAAPIRTALMGGFALGRERSLVADAVAPLPADRVTQTREDVISPLISMAKSLTHDQRASIATADYGEGVDEHLTSLNRVLETDQCRLGQEWHPLEVVELSSHVASNDGFEGCTALLLIKGIHEGDREGNLEFRCPPLRRDYRSLPKKDRRPILRGFRHIYETAHHWDPFLDTFAPERLPLDCFLENEIWNGF